MEKEQTCKGILKAVGTEKLIKLDGKNKVDIVSASAGENYPYHLLSVPCSYGRAKSCLYNFPGSFDIGLLSSVQDAPASKLAFVIKTAEKILKICGMSALAITVNAGFNCEAKLLDLGFTKETTTGNPHSGNTIRFFIKEL